MTLKRDRKKYDTLAELAELAAGTHRRQHSLLGAYQQSPDWRQAVSTLFHAIERGRDRRTRLPAPPASILPGF
jgi:hypothetical protein